jgi:hypothetical protein
MVHCMYNVATLVLGSLPRQGGCKVTGQKGDPRVTSHAFESVKSVREGTLTLPNELPLWEMESRSTPKFLEHNFRGQNPSVGKILYIIGKILRRKCLKWAHITHLNIWNTNSDQKKGRESNWQFDSQSLKVKNWPDFLACRQHATYCWNVIDEGYNFALDLIPIKGLHAKLWAPKSPEF